MSYGKSLAPWMLPFAHRIEKILYYDWDPMRVGSVSQDTTYQRFVEQITLLALNQTPAADLADALWRIEERHLNVDSDPAPTVAIADKIRIEADQYLKSQRQNRSE